jgi:ribosome biogenesis GTPase / thiamine phosphate phosphatase
MAPNENIRSWGWSDQWAEKFSEWADKEAKVARVVRQERDQFFMMSESGPEVGIISGTFMKDSERPVTGDWVVYFPIVGDEKVMIEAVLSRRSELARQGAGEKTVKQVIAANVDWVLILIGLDNDFNMRRLERYLRIISGRNVEAVILLNKVDQTEDLAGALNEVKEIAGDLPVVAVSALTGEGIQGIEAYIKSGETLVCVGSSGVGKSTLINHLMGTDLLATYEVREGDDRGRHTTTQRELVKLPGGALIIDTPGIRELSEWQEEREEDTVDQAFADIEDLSLACKFRDCSHSNEPGCAVRSALEDGTLDAGRHASYLKLQKELAAQIKRQEQAEKIKSRKVQGRSRRIQTPKKR